MDKATQLTAMYSRKLDTFARVGVSSPKKEETLTNANAKMTDREVPTCKIGMRSKKNEIDVGELFDGSLTSEWFAMDRRRERAIDGRSRLLSAKGGPRLQRSWFSGRQWQHGCLFPLPTASRLDEIEKKTRLLAREDKPGPRAQSWLDDVDDWVYDLSLWFRGTWNRVLGSWSQNLDEWKKLLSILPKARRERVIDMIEHGVRLPWDAKKPDNLRDPVTGGCRPNNPRLIEQKSKVWDTIYDNFQKGLSLRGIAWSEMTTRRYQKKCMHITLAKLVISVKLRKITPDQPSMADQAQFKVFYTDQAS